MARTGVEARRTGSVRFGGFLAAFYMAWTLRVVVLLPVDARFQAVWAQQLWSQGLRYLLWVVPVILYVKYVERARWTSFLRLDHAPRRPLLAAAIVVGFLFLAFLSAITLQGGQATSVLKASATRWLGALAWAFTVGFAEECLFRGFIQRKLHETFSSIAANVLTSALFILIHCPGWLYMQGAHAGLVSLSLSVFVLSLVLGVLVEATRSLWPAIVLHGLNNTLSAVLWSS